MGGDLGFVLAGGGPIPIPDVPATTPRMRFTLSVRYAPTGRDTDGDGVPDKSDLCPGVIGTNIPGTPRDGCRHEPPKPDPNTLPLQLFDKPAACTRDPQTVDRFRADGCPADEQTEKTEKKE